MTQNPTILMHLANIASALLGLYSFIIWIRIILTWIRIPGQMTENPFVRFLSKIVDPYLNWFSGIKGLKKQHIDLTPLVAIAVLSIFQSIFSLYGAYGKITIGMVLSLIVRTFWSFILSPAFWFILIILCIRLFFCYKRGPNSIFYIKMLDSMDGSLIDFVQRLFFGKNAVDDRSLVWASIIFYGVLYLLGKYLMAFLASALLKL